MTLTIRNVKSSGLFRGIVFAAVLSAFFFYAPETQAADRCEVSEGRATGGGANEDLQNLAQGSLDAVNGYIKEVANFITLDLATTARKEVDMRLGQLNKNLYPPLFAWWLDDDGARAKMRRIQREKEASGLFEPVVNQETGEVTGEDPNRSALPAAGGEPPEELQPERDEQGDKDHSTLPALRAMTRQLSIAKFLQAMHIGFFVDVRLMNEKFQKRRIREAEAYMNMKPSEMACQMETLNTGADGQTGGAQTKAYEMSRAIARTAALEDMKRRNNYLRTPKEKPALVQSLPLVRTAHAAAAEVSGGGRIAQINELWRKYEECFCDPVRGDQGCPATPPEEIEECVNAENLRGKHTDLPLLLWQDDQTMDFTDPDIRLLNMVAVRTLVAPFGPDPIAATMLSSPDGREELVRRRSYDTRINAIYHVIMQMLAERAGGSGGDATGISRAAGVNNASTRADGLADGQTSSYAEFRAAVSKHRFFQPQYAAHLVDNPAAVVSEQNRIGATQISLFSDMMSRLEERLFMEASNLGAILDVNIPKEADNFLVTKTGGGGG